MVTAGKGEIQRSWLQEPPVDPSIGIWISSGTGRPVRRMFFWTELRPLIVQVRMHEMLVPFYNSLSVRYATLQMLRRVIAFVTSCALG